MLKWIHIKKTAAMTLVCLLALGAWRHHERNRRQEFHMPMKTYAAGRFQLDIPELSTLAGWGRQDITQLGDASVFPNISKRKFKHIIQDRVSNLKNVSIGFSRYISNASTDMIDAGEGTLLEKYMEGPLPNEWNVLFWNENGIKRDYCNSETYYWLQDPKNLSGDGVGYCFNSDFSIDVAKQQKEMEALANCLSLLHLRHDDEVPDGTGFCFQRAFVPYEVPTKGEVPFEAIAAEWRLAHHPDVVISLYTQGAPTVKPEGLIVRHQAPMPEALARFIRGIRSRKRTIGEYAGEEIVAKAKEKNGRVGYNAMWEFEGGDEKDLTRPYITVQMFSGSGEKEPVESSLSEQEFLAMWDAVLESFRWRGPKPGTGKPSQDSPAGAGSPVSVIPPSAPPRPRAALGTRLKSGERCTQAGIWACAHGGNLGGAKRVFREGEELPAAVLGTHRGWFGKLMGRPAETVMDTVWTLEGYPDEA